MHTQLTMCAPPWGRLCGLLHSLQGPGSVGNSFNNHFRLKSCPPTPAALPIKLTHCTWRPHAVQRHTSNPLCAHGAGLLHRIQLKHQPISPSNPPASHSQYSGATAAGGEVRCGPQLRQAGKGSASEPP